MENPLTLHDDNELRKNDSFWNASGINDSDVGTYVNDENEIDRFDSDGLTDIDVVESIENKSVYGWKDSSLQEVQRRSREFKPDAGKRHTSTSTTLKLDNRYGHDDGSGVYSDNEDEGVLAVDDHRIDAPTYDNDNFHHYGGGRGDHLYRRQPSSSRTFSTMPDSPTYDKASPLRRSLTPARSTSSVLHHSPTPQRQQQLSRSRAGTPTHHSKISSSSHMLVDGMGQYYSSPNKDRYTSSPRSQRHSRGYEYHNSGFRNVSSIRGMQMSSPSPPPPSSLDILRGSDADQRFGQSPRSARQRRLERVELQRQAAAGSRSGTPSRHPDPNKEYPLVLLHCSFTVMVPAYPASVLNAALPSWIQENLALLHDKLNPTVIERGVLIPHPGEDYELLEERILENLELKKPRVGKCGHFIASEDSSSSPSVKTATPTGVRSSGDGESFARTFDAIKEESEHFHHGDEQCTTCDQHIRTNQNGTQGDLPQNRFDIRIYAANGLMRSGAWTAAWREMEKIDVEIGVWMPEDIRAALEREAVTQAHEASISQQPAVYAPIPAGYPARGSRDFAIDAYEEESTKGYAYPRAPSPSAISIKGHDLATTGAGTNSGYTRVSSLTLRQRPRSETLGSGSSFSAQVPASTAACNKPGSVRSASPREHKRDSSSITQPKTRSTTSFSSGVVETSETTYDRSSDQDTEAEAVVRDDIYTGPKPISELLQNYLKRKINSVINVDLSLRETWLQLLVVLLAVSLFRLHWSNQQQPYILASPRALRHDSNFAAIELETGFTNKISGAAERPEIRVAPHAPAVESSTAIDAVASLQSLPSATASIEENAVSSILETAVVTVSVKDVTTSVSTLIQMATETTIVTQTKTETETVTATVVSGAVIDRIEEVVAATSAATSAADHLPDSPSPSTTISDDGQLVDEEEEIEAVTESNPDLSSATSSASVLFETDHEDIVTDVHKKSSIKADEDTNEDHPTDTNEVVDDETL